MSTNQQKQLELEREQLEREKDRLLEIYKLHAQLTGDLGNRLTTTNRFYPTIMSGLLAFSFAFLQRQDIFLPEGINVEFVVPLIMNIVGYLGGLLSLAWFISVRYHYRMITRKYEILMELEAELEFQFFTQEWGDTKDIPYRRFSQFETRIPYAFILIFFASFMFGTYKIIAEVVLPSVLPTVF